MELTTISARTFGVELELVGATRSEVSAALNAAGINCRVTSYHGTVQPGFWNASSDSSIRDDANYCEASGGLTCELVSPILAGDDGLNQIRRVCAILQGIGVHANATCGLHVHHGMSDWSLPTLKGLAKRWLKYERVIDSYMAPSRRNNTYCQSIRDRFNGVSEAISKIQKATNGQKVMEVLTNGDRYHKLNLCPLWSKGTVEFRGHAGTVDASAIIAWVVMGQGLIENAAVSPNVIAAKTADGDGEAKNLFSNFTGSHKRVLSRYYQAQAA